MGQRNGGIRGNFLAGTWRALGASFVAAAVGCAPRPPAELTATSSGLVIPLALRGQDTQFRLNFPPTGHGSDSGRFEQGEICYLGAGDFRIDCYTNGSYLTLGPTDSTTLLADNPTSELTAADGNKLSEQAVRLYGVLFLIGGSIERLPEALSEYIQEPGTHQNEAVSLAQALLGRGPVDMKGYARGGNFSVTVVLTDAGREKLVDALDNAGDSAGSTQLVAAPRRSPRSPANPVKLLHPARGR